MATLKTCTGPTGRRSRRILGQGSTSSALFDGERLVVMFSTGKGAQTLSLEFEPHELAELTRRILQAVVSGRMTWRVFEEFTKLGFQLDDATIDKMQEKRRMNQISEDCRRLRSGVAS